MTAYYNEHDPFAAQWLRNLITAGHIASGDVDERSILDVRPSDLSGYRQCHFFAGIGVWSYALRNAGWPDSRKVWTGSCPCQPFSAAGKGGGFDDERHLWPALQWLVQQCRPDIVFGEQVASRDGLAWLDLVSTDLEAMGYACGAVPFPAAGVGAPHIRQRLYWVADTDCRGINRSREGRPGRRDERPDGGATRLLADSHGGDTCAEGLQRGRQHGQFAQNCGAGIVADTDDAGSQGRCLGRDCADERAIGARGLVGRAGPTNSVWRDADWLYCRDNRWRPVEPGTFPLAHGVAGRVGRLRAYGNAIVAQQAQAFISAYLEVSAEKVSEAA